MKQLEPVRAYLLDCPHTINSAINDGGKQVSKVHFTTELLHKGFDPHSSECNAAVILTTSVFIYNGYIQRITMCPHGCHHNGFMETPALGTQEVRLHIVWTAL